MWLFYIHNITAVSINNTSVLITWDNLPYGGHDFCSNWREQYTWKLQILKWHNWTNLYDKNFKDIRKAEYYSLDDRKTDYSLIESMCVNLTKKQCTTQSYLLNGLSPHIYYKFQILFGEIGESKTSIANGSYIYYFGKQS